MCEKRWFEIKSTLTYETLFRRMEGLVKLIRYYELKYDRQKDNSKEEYKPLNKKDTHDVNELLWVCVDFPFQSYRTDVIKDRLWRLLDL